MRNSILSAIVFGLLFVFSPITAKATAPEIIELAGGLKHNPDFIYEYVYNNIKTLPQYGSLKGPLGALLDGEGTAFDQAELMAQLLQESGYTPTYHFGQIHLTAAQLTNWLGVDDSYYSVNYALGNGGFPGATTPASPPGPVTGGDVGWAWISTNIGGTDYVFDPATKSYDRLTGLSSLSSVLSYTQSTFINNAKSGSTTSFASINGINRTNIRSDLTTYATNLANYIKTNNPSASTGDIIGDQSVQQIPVNTQLRQTSLSYAVGAATTGTSIPGSYRSTLTITLPGASGSPFVFNSSDLYGHRLSLVFVGSPASPVLYLDGVAVPGGTGSLQTYIRISSSGSTYISKGANPGIHVSHPFASTVVNPACGATPVSFADSCGDLTAIYPGTFVFNDSWGPVNRGMVEYHRKLLVKNISAQTTPDPGAEEVLGESLKVIGLTWLAEGSRAIKLTGQFGGGLLTYNHSLGFIGIYGIGSGQGPYIDLPYNALSAVPLANAPSTGITPAMTAMAFTLSEATSILESGVLEQTQPGLTAISTAKVFDLQTPYNPTFDINNSAISGDNAAYYTSTIRPQLSSAGFGADDLSFIDGYVSAGLRVIVPRNGHVVSNQWAGAGYFVSHGVGNGASSVITGGYFGGGIDSPVSNSTLTGNTSFSFAPDSLSFTNTIPGVSSGGSGATLASAGDHVNAVTGDYLYRHNDLTVGSAGSFPYQLDLQRSYDSGQRLNSAASPFGRGWTHNFAITALKDSDGFEGLGINSPINGSAAIAALYVTQDILNPGAAVEPAVDRIAIAASVQAWMMEQLTGKAVKVTQPGRVEQFYQLADGSYNPPMGSGSSLTGSSGSYVYKTKDQIALTFNGVGNLSTWHSPSGPTVTLSYNGSNQLTSIANAMGRTINLTYTGAHVTNVSDPVSSRSVTYTYNANDELATYKDPANNTTTYNYEINKRGRLTKIFYPTNPAVPYVTNTYDTINRVMTQADALNNVTNFYFAGTQTEIDNPAGVAQYYLFTPRGKLWSSIDGLFNITYNIYDGLDRITQTTFPEGNRSLYLYDTRNNLNTKIDVPKPGSPLAIRAVSSAFDLTYNKPISFVDGDGNITLYTYDPTTGNLTDVYQPTIGVSTPHQSFTYNARGQVLTSTDAMGKVTKYTYDATTEKLLTVTEDFGNFNLLTTNSYDTAGNLISVTDPNTNVTTMDYDAVRRVTKITGPTSTAAVTKYTYDLDGNLLKTERATGNVLAPWQSASTTYSASFKPLTTTDAAGNVTTNYYDGLDRLWATVDPETRTTVIGYDTLNRQNAITNWDIQATPLLQYTYTFNGKRASMIDANNHTTNYTYDGYDRVSTTTYPDTTTESATYDNNDNVLTKLTRGGLTITYTYDVLNRLSTKAPQSQPTVTTTYDLTGRPLSISDSAGAFTYVYDTAGRNTSVTRPDTKVTSFQYDSNGNRTRVTWPDTYYATYIYDALNRLTQVKENGSTSLAIYAYDPLSRRTGITYGNTSTAAYTYSTNNDLATVTHSFNGSAVTYTYTNNLVHQRTGIAVSDATYMWHPPAANPWLAYTVNTINQYSAIGGSPISYSTAGNLTGDGLNSFTYDTENRLAAASKTGMTATYAFDPLSRRKSKTVNSVTTGYLSEGDREIAEYDGSGTFQRRMVYGPGLDEPVVIIDASSVKNYVHTDGLGSIVALTNASGTVIDKYTYSPFGESASLAGAASRFTGRRIDPETGLYHYRARAYSPTIGRFLQADPIGYEGGNNLYAYVNNDPLNLTDPMGQAVMNYFDSWTGHIGIAPGNSTQSYGLYPSENTFNAVIGTVPGLMQADAGFPSRSINIPTSPFQDAMMNSIIANQMVTPSAYNLGGYSNLRGDISALNCATFGVNTFSTVNIPVFSTFQNVPSLLMNDMIQNAPFAGSPGPALSALRMPASPITFDSDGSINLMSYVSWGANSY